MQPLAVPFSSFLHARLICLAIVVGWVGTALPSGNTYARDKPRLGAHAVVTANRAATSAAAKTLRLGGSAADAAIAAQLVLGVVEPQSSGIGGGAVVLYRESANGPVRAFDGLSRSPGAFDPQTLSAKSFSHSGAAIGIPGSLRLMEFLHSRYGKLPWSTLFEPAIEIASKGFEVSPYLARSLAAAVKRGYVPPAWLRDDTGGPVREGVPIRNQALALTMRAIAQDGADALYIRMAPEIVSVIRNAELPGAITEDDFRNYKVAERAPLCDNYHQIQICTFPPPSYGGIAVLELLGLLDRLHANDPDFLDVNFVHFFIEAGRIAEVDRADIVGDPDVEPVSAGALLDERFLRQRAKLIDAKTSIKDPIRAIAPDGRLGVTCFSTAKSPPPSTSQIAIVDSWGAALSMTTTININFGSWLSVQGFFLNDAMTNFTCARNQPAPNKRPETAMAPVIVLTKSGQTLMIGGSAGGGEIVDYVAQALLELTHGVLPLKALDTGHVSSAKAPYAGSPGRVELEQGRAIASLAPRLTELGHDVRTVPLESGLGFLVRKNGSWLGAADPRRDGTFDAAK